MTGVASKVVGDRRYLASCCLCLEQVGLALQMPCYEIDDSEVSMRGGILIGEVILFFSPCCV